MGQDELSRLHEQAQAKVEAELAKAKHPSSDGLRQLADWLDEMAADGLVCTLHSKVLRVGFYTYGDLTEQEAVRKVAAGLGTFSKEYGEHDLTLVRDFGNVKANFRFRRETVCKRVVTGTKTLPAVTIPAKPAEPEKVLPEQTIEVVEWQCGESLLAKTFDELEATS